MCGWLNWQKWLHNKHTHTHTPVAHDQGRRLKDFIMSWCGFLTRKGKKNVLFDYDVHENVNVCGKILNLNWTNEWVLMPGKLPAELKTSTVTLSAY